jgi:hypothetical protein
MARWQLAAIGGAVALVILVVSGFLLFESGGKSSSGGLPVAPPPPAAVSYGHARITGATTGGPYQRTVIVRVKNRSTGVPLHNAKITIHGEMIAHEMRLYDTTLHEAGRGEYKGPYTFVMPGQWKVVVIATSKSGDTSTGSFPVNVTG